ncbi:MAG: dihydrodipicolinate synthase family protein [Polaromonas sp.]|nr:dihydrodipicolinate synthase family protein [Polaromonas sp.]
MNSQQPARIKGVLSPVVTPFSEDLSVNENKFVDHCKWLVGNGVGLAIFGTNSEANSLSVSERLYLTDKLLEAGIDASRLMPGTGCCSIPDTVKLTQHATKHGAAGVLMLPPFYYKDISEDGLFAYFSEIVERVGSSALRIYLYHIPQVTQVAITESLIERLLKRYPESFAGIKDSSGDWAGTQKFIHAFAANGFDVFPGSEIFMLDALRIGGVGCISATANVNPKGIVELYENWQSYQADALNETMTSIRKTCQMFAVLPAMKDIIATYRKDPTWAKVRPPLMGLDEKSSASLKAKLDLLNFEMKF